MLPHDRVADVEPVPLGRAPRTKPRLRWYVCAVCKHPFTRRERSDRQPAVTCCEQHRRIYAKRYSVALPGRCR
jgi:hypothetical protein